MDNEFSLPTKRVIYKLEENIIQGEREKVDSFPVRPNEIFNLDLKRYLLNTHPKLETEFSKIEELASRLSVEISFRDASGKFWKKKFNGKLKREYLKDLMKYFS